MQVSLIALVLMTLRLASAQSALALVGSGYPQPVSHLGFAPGQIVTIQVVGMKAISPLLTVQRATTVPLPVTLAGISVALKQSVIGHMFDSPVALPPHSAVLLSVGQSDLCGVAPIPAACLLTSIALQIPFELTLRHNRYRLIAKIHFAEGILEVVSVLTHAEYDRGGWKDGCGC